MKREGTGFVQWAASSGKGLCLSNHHANGSNLHNSNCKHPANRAQKFNVISTSCLQVGGSCHPFTGRHAATLNRLAHGGLVVKWLADDGDPSACIATIKGRPQVVPNGGCRFAGHLFVQMPDSPQHWANVNRSSFVGALRYLSSTGSAGGTPGYAGCPTHTGRCHWEPTKRQ